MKFLIGPTNGPTIATGYGVQCKQLIERLKRDGHDVAVAANYGQQGIVAKYPTPYGDVRIYPGGYEVNANDVIHVHAMHWFSEGAEPGTNVERNGWIIPLLDLWSLPNPVLSHFNLAPWTPVDHRPVPPEVLQFFHRNPDAIPIAMSRFGEAELFKAGLAPAYIPLSVDTKRIRPMQLFDLGDENFVPCRKVFGLPENAFVIGMVAMNKGWARDRKGFNEAFCAFGFFRQNHPDAILFVHSEKLGAAEGINLVHLAQHYGIPEHAIVWSDQYAYRIGLPPEMMAAAYSSMDVLLAPSHGEGFCVPLIEAQAAGTPVIATDFSSQSELIGAGWKIDWQPEWDPAGRAGYACPSPAKIVEALEACYALSFEERKAMSESAFRFAQQYDADTVYETYWRPFIKRLEKIQSGETLALSEPRKRMESVDILVPLMRPQNEYRFFDSLDESGFSWGLRLAGDATSGPSSPINGFVVIGEEGKTYGENVNECFARSSADWVLVVGDDVEFTPGWFEAAQALSERYDVIGTNDSEPGRVRNPEVAKGRHADHFFIRRAYIDEVGSSLDGPGTVISPTYGHWFSDKETIELARARRVFGMASECRIIHHHPGYDGDEEARTADPVYMKALDTADEDRATFLARLPLIQMQRA